MPVVNFVGTIVRCRRCRTYINAYVMFTDGGRRWRCNVCSLLNEGGSQVIVLEMGGQWVFGCDLLVECYVCCVEFYMRFGKFRLRSITCD